MEVGPVEKDQRAEESDVESYKDWFGVLFRFVIFIGVEFVVIEGHVLVGRVVSIVVVKF